MNVFLSLYLFIFIRFTQDEQLNLNDKLAFAARYLNNQRLYEKIDKLADESRKKGAPQGFLSTGL